MEKDERLIALIRAGHDRAFEVLFERYHARLLAFCRSMLRSTEDAEDVLQEVFVNAHKAILQDSRKINARPWLYRIARNRCLNHLRKPVADGQDTMDDRPHLHGTTTAERVQKREELRELLDDVEALPETQRSALLLREIDQLSYDEIALAMDTTIPSVKSLLVRARMGLAESSQARALTCDDVQLDLAEAAEGLKKIDGPVRKHVKTCEGCDDFRRRLRSDQKALAALAPFAPLLLLKQMFAAKLGGGAAAGGSVTALGGSGVGAAGSAATSLGAISGGAAATGTTMGAVGGALGTKAAAGVATAALITAGAVEVGTNFEGEPISGAPAPVAKTHTVPPIVKERKSRGRGAETANRVAPAGAAAASTPGADTASHELLLILDPEGGGAPVGAGDAPGAVERDQPNGISSDSSAASGSGTDGRLIVVTATPGTAGNAPTAGAGADDPAGDPPATGTDPSSGSSTEESPAADSGADPGSAEETGSADESDGSGEQAGTETASDPSQASTDPAEGDTSP